MSDWRMIAQTGAAAAAEVREYPDGEVAWRVGSSSGAHGWGCREAPSLAIAFELDFLRGRAAVVSFMTELCFLGTTATPRKQTRGGRHGFGRSPFAPSKMNLLMGIVATPPCTPPRSNQSPARAE